MVRAGGGKRRPGGRQETRRNRRPHGCRFACLRPAGRSKLHGRATARGRHLRARSTGRLGQGRRACQKSAANRIHHRRTINAPRHAGHDRGRCDRYSCSILVGNGTAASRRRRALNVGYQHRADLSSDRRHAGQRLPDPGDGAGRRIHLRHVRHRRWLPDDTAVDLRRGLAGGGRRDRFDPYRCLVVLRRAQLLSAGIIGTATGVWLFTELRALDQLDLVIGVLYVSLLSAVGLFMIYESIKAELRARKGLPSLLRRPGSHNWLHGLPLKLRFKRSKIYVSAIPVWGIGFVIGFAGAIMGIGGGFLLVPMLIYFLRVPTGTVIGTSMILTLITMASATVMHAVTNHLVDAILALILMVGGVIGAQFGAHTGQRMRGERLRLLLGILVFLVGLRFAFELVVQPEDLYSIRHVGEM